MDSQRLRAIILDIEYHLSDEDRRRLHFYVGGAVPRRLRDDPSLSGTLNIMEKLIEEGRISENDLTFLINAFDQIHCMNAVELLKGHLRRNQSKELNQSVRDISKTMPYMMINEIDDNEEDKCAQVKCRLILNQQNISKDENIPLNSNTENINIQMQEIGNNEPAISPIKGQEPIFSPAAEFQTWQLLTILLLVIGFAILIIFSVLPIMKYKQCSNQLQHCKERIKAKAIPLCASAINISPNAKWKQNGTTVAGGHGYGYGMNQLSYPHGLDVDDNQTIYIADNTNHRTMEWEYGATNGKVVAGGNYLGNGINQLTFPSDVVIDKERDKLIICDFTNRRVVRWARRNNGSTSGETIISNIDCAGLSMDGNGFLYVVDYRNNAVRRYQMDGSDEKVVAGGNGKGNGLHQLSNPYYVFVDRDHSVYVSDRENHRVMKWEKNAEEGVVVAGGNGAGSSLTRLHYPRGVAVDQLGTVYVADTDNHRIMRWTKGSAEGNVIVGGNGRGNQSNQLMYPFGLSFDRNGNLYVADCLNHRVQKFEIE